MLVHRTIKYLAPLFGAKSQLRTLNWNLGVWKLEKQLRNSL